MSKFRRMWQLYLLLFCATLGLIYVGLQTVKKQDKDEKVTQEEQQHLPKSEDSEDFENPNVNNEVKVQPVEGTNKPSVSQELTEAQDKKEEEEQSDKAKQPEGKSEQEIRDSGKLEQLGSKNKQENKVPSSKPEQPEDSSKQENKVPSGKPEQPEDNGKQENKIPSSKPEQPEDNGKQEGNIPSKPPETSGNRPSQEPDVTLEKEHKWGNWFFKNDKEDQRICSLCGDVENQPHQFISTGVTYQEKGERGHTVNEAYKCNICNKAQYTNKYVEAHQYSNWETVKNHTKVRHCYICDYQQTRTEYDNSGNNNSGNDDSGHDRDRHIWGNWVFKNEEEDERTCFHCGKKETQKHEFKEAGTKYEVGQDDSHVVSKFYVCITCNIAKYTNTFAEKHQYDDGTKEIISNNNGTHNIDTAYLCSICGNTYKDTKQEKCQYGEWQDIGNNIQARQCEVCNHEETKQIEHQHDWSDWVFKDDEEDERTCSICGEKEQLPHNFKKTEVTYEVGQNGTHIVNEKHVCTNCNKAQSVKTFEEDHKYEQKKEEAKNNHNGTHTIETTYSCSVCGNTYTDTEKKSCEYGDWKYVGSYTKVRYCKVCNYKQTYTNKPQHSHSWGEWVVKNDKEEERTCRTCGKKETRTHTHQYNSQTKDITSNQDGTHTVNTEYTCVSCSNNYVDTVQEACKFGDWKFNEDGTMVRSCSICNYQESTVHKHDEIPDDLVYQCKAPNQDNTHLLEGSYICQSCGETVTVNKNEACELGEPTINRSGVNDKHSVIRVCKVCQWNNEEYQDCEPTGEVKCRKVYDQIYEYYDCLQCGDWCNRSYHTVHRFGPWESRGPDNGHIRYCICVEAREIEEHNYVVDNENSPTMQICTECGETKEVPSVSHNHGKGTYDNMDRTEMIKLAMDELTSFSPVVNPNPSPDSYCIRYEFMCKTCGIPYYVHISHDFENGVCTRQNCSVK